MTKFYNLRAMSNTCIWPDSESTFCFHTVCMGTAKVLAFDSTSVQAVKAFTFSCLINLQNSSLKKWGS